jgi:hemerythrin-like domain-containing protein
MDLYASTHKALRSFMADTLGAVGRMGADDAEERGATLAQLRSLLDLLEHHADIEDAFIHTAMQSRRPGSAHESAAEHLRQRPHLAPRDWNKLIFGIAAAPLAN